MGVFAVLTLTPPRQVRDEEAHADDGHGGHGDNHGHDDHGHGHAALPANTH
jgi:hypothetical protein